MKELVVVTVDDVQKVAQELAFLLATPVGFDLEDQVAQVCLPA